MFPHPEKWMKGGEDAFFISDSNHAFGVADGVGGWITSGVDSGKFSRRFMSGCKDSSERHRTDPVKIMEMGFNEVLRARVPGSCTAMVAVLDGNLLKVCNLGDSGLLVLRQDRQHGFMTVLRTKEQQHYFNCPYQIEIEQGDRISDGDLYEVSLLPDDIIIAGTDGVFDNLFEKEIIDTINYEIVHFKDEEDFEQRLAIMIGTQAVRESVNSTRPTPFSQNAAKHNLRFSGGKLDDVCVVVSTAYIP